MNLSFKEPKIRLGNRTYTSEQLDTRRRETQKRYNTDVREGKDSKYTEFYHTRAWNRTRQQVLIRDNYLCQHCLRKGIVNDKHLIVHHIVELKRDWNKRLDMENLEAVCRTCHNKIHRLI